MSPSPNPDPRRERPLSDHLTLEEAFELLHPDERQLLTCALAGNHPPHLAHLRMPILRALAKCDHQQRVNRMGAR